MSEHETPEQHIKFMSEVGPVLSMARVPNIDYGQERYFDFMSQYYWHVQRNLDTLKWNDDGPDGEVVPQVLLRLGDPNSGKTFIGKSTRNAILPRLSGLSQIQGKGYEKYVIGRNWEEHGEKEAIRRGLVKSAIDEPFERDELYDCEEVLKESLAEAIKSPLAAAVEVELPGGIEATVNGVTKNYRPLGARVVRELVKKQGIFEDLNYVVWAMVSVGGPYLQGGLRFGRELVRRSSNLEEAEMYAHRYGMIKKSVTLSPEYWDLMKNGAYMKQMPVIDKAIHDLMIDIGETAEIKSARSIAEQYPYDNLTQMFVSQSDIDYQHPWVQGARWQRFLENRDSVGLDSERAIIAHYNPTPTQLGITREDIRYIQQDMARAA